MYVSKSLIAPAQLEVVLNEIVIASRQRNARLGVTGCLISARTRFAQFLEGPPDVLAKLRHSIRADYRHAEVTTVNVSQVEGRRFEGWSLGYAGPSVFVDDIIDQQPLSGLLRLMEEFTSGRHHVPSASDASIVFSGYSPAG